MHTQVKLYLLLLVIAAECGRTKYSRAEGRVKNEQVKFGRREVFENIFVVYDPSFLSLVWPKISNGVHLLIEQTCWDDVSVLFRHYTEGRAWAYKVVDASGRYPSALFNGDRFWLGSKAQCLRMDYDYTSRSINETYEDLQNSDYVNAVFPREKYFDHALNDWRWVVHHEELMRRTIAADNCAPFRLAYTAVMASLNITKLTMAKLYDLTIGVCMPRSCTPDDVKSIINFSIMINDNLKTNKTTPRVAKITSMRRIEGGYDVTDDPGAIALIAISLVLTLLTVVATVIDLDWKCVPYTSNKMSFDLQKYSEHGKSVRVEKRRNIEAKTLQEMDKFAKMEHISMELQSKMPPAVILDVNTVRQTNCKRCGKYRKQCPTVGSNTQTCTRIQYNSSITALSTADNEKNTLFCRLLLCFSITYCWRRVFNKNTSNKDLALVHGLKIFATLWVIYLHVAMMANYASDKAVNLNDREGAYYVLTTGTTAFDILFFVSGLFSAHHFFFLKSRYSVEELVSFGGACGQILQFVCFVTNRVIRLLPSYAFAVLLSGVLARVSRGTSAITLPDADHDTCRHYWWRNLLYITTMYPAMEQCMQVSWYLTTETQLHVVGALLCLGAARARLVLAAGALAAIAAAAVDVTGAYLHYGTTFADVYALYATIVGRPWARVAPYLAGVFAGWFIQKNHGNINTSRATTMLLWLSSAFLLVASIAVPWSPRAWLAAWAHLTWPLTLLWPTLFASTTLSGWCSRMHGPVSAAVSRLCTGAVLLHAPLARLILLSADSALCSHTSCVWMYFTGTTVLTFLAALVLALLVEMPCCSLLRRLSDCAS